MEQQDIWVCIGWGSWGRGTSFKEAFTNWMKHAGDTAKECSIYRFEGEFDPTQITVDDMGGLTYPKVAKCRKVERFQVTRPMHQAYGAWNDMVDSIEYGEDGLYLTLGDD